MPRRIDYAGLRFWYDQGLSDGEISEKTGVKKGAVTGWRNRNNLPSNYVQRDTICWECGRNIAECPWLHSNKAVPGWDADELDYTDHKGITSTTYFVKKCPLHIERTKKPGEWMKYCKEGVCIE